MRARSAVLAALVGGAVALAAACGVEVPDDVAADVRGPTTSTTAAAEAPSTTEAADELEQALIDQGLDEDEAACGAANLRRTLDDDEIASVIAADTVEDVPGRTGRAVAAALRPCLQGGGLDPDDPDADDPDADDPDGPTPGGGRPVSRAQFLSGLIAGGTPEAEARCIVAAVYRQLDPEEISVLFNADSDADVPADVRDAFAAITRSCR